MTYKEVVPTNYNPSKSQRDVLYALGDNLYVTERVAERHESVGKAQVVTPKELQGKMKEYFGHQPKGLTDYPKDENKNYRIFSAAPEGVKAAETYTNSSLEDRRKSDAQWIKNTANLLDKVVANSILDVKDLDPAFSKTISAKDPAFFKKVCALQAAQNEVSDESKSADQHYLRVKKGKENAAKNHEKTASPDGPEL